MSLADAAGLPRGARLPGDRKPKASARDMLRSLFVGRYPAVTLLRREPPAVWRVYIFG